MNDYGRTIRRMAVPLAVVGMVLVLPQMSAACTWPSGRLQEAVQLAADRAEAIADSIASGAQQWWGSNVVAVCPQRVVEVVSLDDRGVELIAPDRDVTPCSQLWVDLHLTSMPPPTC